jgi:predicted TIM-barrel fold metal-dependent hydrolase
MAKNGFRIMDSDIHVDEPPDLWAKYIDPKFRDRAPAVKNRDTGFGLVGWHFDGRPFPAYIDRPERQRAAKWRRDKAKVRNVQLGRNMDDLNGSDPHSMLRGMDAEGVDIAVVFRTQCSHLIAIDTLDPELSAAVCRAYNNWLADFCSADRNRLKPAAVIPVHDLGLAVKEANRAVRDLGAVSLVLNSNPVKGINWYDRHWDPLWETAVDLNVAATFHGIHTAYHEGHLGRRYLDNYPLARAAGQPVELMLALGSMVLGGVLARFPKLRAGFFEGHCSWLPWWLWCMDEHWEKFGDEELYCLEMPPSEYFRRQCCASADADEFLVKSAIESIGNDNFVFSTDWPHDDAYHPKAVDTFLGIEGVSDDSKRKILWDNCARLYGL